MGPLAALGLAAPLADALEAESQRDLSGLAAPGLSVEQSEGRLPPQLIWPMLERKARALREL